MTSPDSTYPETLSAEECLKRYKGSKEGARYYGEALTSDEVVERLHEEKKCTKGPSKKKCRQSPPEAEETTSCSRAADESEVEAHDKGVCIIVKKDILKCKLLGVLLAVC